MHDTGNPWHTKESRTVYKNPWISVREDQVVRPDGQDGIYGVVEFKNWAIGIVPVTENGDTFLVGQHRYPLGFYCWEIPEGGGPTDATPLESAQRELQEEVGLTAAKWTYLGELALSNSVTNEIGCVFLAQDLTFGESDPEGTEKLQIKRVPLKTAYEMALTGEISDGLAIVGLVRAYQYLYGDKPFTPIARCFPGLGAPDPGRL
jgi:8-oxo-dGTP pyrophosphatase MutT (NUDIX family)